MTRVVLTLLLATASLARAQQAPSQTTKDCVASEVAKLTSADLPGPWGSRHPDSVFARLGDAIRRNAWTAVHDTLLQTFQLSAGELSAAELPPDVRRRMLAALNALSPVFDAAQVNPGALSTQIVPEAHWSIVWIDDSSPERYALLRTTPNRIEVSDEMPRAARRTICWTALATRRVLTLLAAPGRERTVTELRRLNTLWDNYRDHSHSQLPWELWLNGRLTLREGDLSPPRLQFILAHAAPGLEFSDRPWHRASATYLEAAGVLLYNAERTSYGGASLIVRSAADRGIGWGPMLHVGKLKAGYLLRKPRPAEFWDGIIVSADLYDFLTGARKLIERRELRATARLLACHLDNTPDRCEKPR